MDEVDPTQSGPDPGGQDRSRRFRDLESEGMTEAQRRVAEEAVSGQRKRLPAPLRAWLHSPEFGRRAQKLGEFLRFETVLGPVVSELAILVTARFWNAHYEWFVHKSAALDAGLDPAIVAAIAERRTPVFQDAKLSAVYDYAMAVHQAHGVTEKVHAAAHEALGEQGLVELVGVLGYYTLVSMTLNVFQIGPPDGEPLELQS